MTRHDEQPVADLELTRSTDDRRLYGLGEIGTLRVGGWFARTATAETGDRAWQFVGRGFWRRSVDATDESGVVVGTFEPRSLRRGGALRWDGREFALRPASSWRERYALVDGDRERALLDGRGWGKRPVRVTVVDPAIEPGLLLFAVFVVRGLAEDASSAGGAASVAATG
jgi:hypothetical protein